jgi:5-methylcytosine-specific restriction endonuclease McrA
VSRNARSRVLEIVRTDSSFAREDVRGVRAWVGRCIHCGSRIVVEESGATLATVEHIVPRNHGGTDELTNLALACARCNQGKGTRLDARKRSDPTLRAVIETLQARRKERWREP